MEQIKSWNELTEKLQQEPILLVYLSSTDCGVCKADELKIDQMRKELSFPSVSFDVNDVPEAAGQLNVFSMPAVLLFFHQKEYHRQTRIIDFYELDKRMKELIDAQD